MSEGVGVFFFVFFLQYNLSRKLAVTQWNVNATCLPTWTLYTGTTQSSCSPAPPTLFCCTDATPAGDIITAATATTAPAHVRVVQYLPHLPHTTAAATTFSNT